MALITCRECKKEISSGAAACPHCGAHPPQKTSFVTWFVTIAIALIVLISISRGGGDRPSNASAQSAPLTTEQNAAKQAAEVTFNKVVIAATAVKSSMRNPASLEWQYIGANKDASVICLEYRGQNGFGGMNKEFAVYVKGKPSQAVSSWNKNCVGQSLNDMTFARRAIE